MFKEIQIEDIVGLITESGKDIQLNNSRLFGMTDDKGQMTSFILVHFRDNQTVVIDEIFTGKAFVNKGFEQKQVEHVISWARAEGAVGIVSSIQSPVFDDLGFDFVGEKSATKYHKGLG